MKHALPHNVPHTHHIAFTTLIQKYREYVSGGKTFDWKINTNTNGAVSSFKPYSKVSYSRQDGMITASAPMRFHHGYYLYNLLASHKGLHHLKLQ